MSSVAPLFQLGSEIRLDINIQIGSQIEVILRFDPPLNNYGYLLHASDSVRPAQVFVVLRVFRVHEFGQAVGQLGTNWDSFRLKIYNYCKYEICIWSPVYVLDLGDLLPAPEVLLEQVLHPGVHRGLEVETVVN